MRLWFVVLCGCGRINFAPTTSSDDAAVDAQRFQLDAGECPANYEYRSVTHTPTGLTVTGCVRYDAASVTWVEAEARCEADLVGSHLVIVDSVQKDHFVDTVQPPALLSNWVGLSDRRQEGTFQLVTGAQATYLNWEPGSPIAGGPDCLEFLDATTVRDVSCDAANSFICEYDGVPADPMAF